MTVYQTWHLKKKGTWSKYLLNVKLAHIYVLLWSYSGRIYVHMFCICVCEIKWVKHQVTKHIHLNMQEIILVFD